MEETIVIVSNKSDASLLVPALQSEEGSSSFRWKGDTIEFQSVTGLCVSGVGFSSANAIASILALRGLTALTLSFNGIANLPSFLCLEGLQHLDLSHNKLTDLEALRDMRSLRVFRCNNNHISSLEPLRSVLTLTELWISNNNVSWDTLINLQPHVNLKSIVLYNNPLESKLNIEDFLKAICRPLESINGNIIVRQKNDDFLSTPDGRVMATQARAQLTLLQREDIRCALKRKTSSKALLKSGSLRSLAHPKGDEEVFSARTISSAGANTGLITAGVITSPCKSEPGERTRVYKAQRNKTISGLGQKYDHIAQKSVSAAAPKLQSLANSDKIGYKFVVESNDNSTAKADTPLTGGDASVIVHFGQMGSSPIAVCLYPTGAGYARWNRGGTVACSFEAGGRLFSSHKGGALAAVLAPDGSGSVMDEHGNSVLTLKTTGEAIIFNPAGEIECTFQHQSANEQGAIENTEVLTIYDGTARKKAKKISLGDIFSENNEAIYSFTLRWIFSDLVVDFIPNVWEVNCVIFHLPVVCDGHKDVPRLENIGCSDDIEWKSRLQVF